ncbi:hypothetical protein PF005_g13566 [Phytophthora fragariae]|uniref:Uncharacterized protein n=1 Tax=Phytophthora fragariae TaxID=53985 RepID=A0A6A3XT82_9STRA|nr:hypothetical protein PF009_g12878 [Phytophthora fragariae]KAE9068870.1 hypothetical protein PF010_g26889 [Phytophthora fragariae]KAE9141302.1 hypothetical protein PF006_g13227 [Phytophthora fragariae]KAE9174626.1 hypothetical protein PF004_g26615 [Phytophthora fragariae]KAE9205049.1 hypothetical protein PF005_g13566 [Phytophthora fragariae]
MSTLPTAKVLPVVNLSVHTFVLWILWSAMALSAYALASACGDSTCSRDGAR